MLEIVQTSSLEKILPKNKIEVSPFLEFTTLKDEKLSYQIAYRRSGLSKTYEVKTAKNGLIISDGCKEKPAT